MIWIVSVPFSLYFGAYSLSTIDVFSLHIDSPEGAILSLRLVRAVLALLVGGGLAVSGSIFQCVLRNPLADPYTLGVASGGALGASLVLSSSIVLPAFAMNILVPVAGLIGAMLALGSSLSIVYLSQRQSKETLILAGIIVSTFCSALISLVKVLYEDSISSIFFWLMGSLQFKSWEHIYIIGIWYGIALAILVPYIRTLEVLLSGDTVATSVGVSVKRTRFMLLLGASIISAVAVSTVGIIAFVGLIIPHIVFLCTHRRSFFVLVSTFLGGGLVVLWSDVLARSIMSSGAELPVGIITSLLGSPFFFFLLIRSKNRNGEPT